MDKLQRMYNTANRFSSYFISHINIFLILESRFQPFELKLENILFYILINSKSIFLQPINKTLEHVRHCIKSKKDYR